MIKGFRLFIIIFAPAALAMIIAIGIMQQKNAALVKEQFNKMLINQWDTVAAYGHDEADHERLRAITQQTGLRITIVARNGNVLFDTVATTLEPHAERVEIRSAFAGEPMMDVRYSRTLQSYLFYYADMLDNDTVLRVSYPAIYYDSLRYELLRQIIISLGVLLVLVALFALYMSRRTSNTMRHIGIAMNDARQGKTDIAAFDNGYLDETLAALSSASRELHDKNNENTILFSTLRYVLNNIDEGVIIIRDHRVLYSNTAAEEIIEKSIPSSIYDIQNKEMLLLFNTFANENISEIDINGKVVHVNIMSSGTERLIILHNVSDSTKYSYFKADLVGNISHELKTPLTLIMGAAETIRDTADIPRPVMDKFLGTIYNNSARMNMILDDLIQLHRLERAPRADNAHTITAELVNDLKDMQPAGKNVTYNIAPETVGIEHTHLLSILSNLISNAAKYSTSNDISVSLTKNNNAVEIRVEDGGPVIPAAERKRIFERFYSVSKSRNRVQSGSGLGLSIVKHTARLYAGRAFVVENQRGGNTFIVQLTEN